MRRLLARMPLLRVESYIGVHHAGLLRGAPPYARPYISCGVWVTACLTISIGVRSATTPTLGLVRSHSLFHIRPMGNLWQVVRGLVWPRGGNARSPSVAGLNARGMNLLVEHLSPAQRAQYGRFKYFDVVGGNSGRRYRIRHGQVLNVEVLDSTGHCMCLLCFMPRGHLPVGDVMLAQKLALEAFEAEAIKVAHMSPSLHMRTRRDLRLQWRLRR